MGDESRAGGDAQARRRDRLAEALRANLKRRKTQERARAAERADAPAAKPTTEGAD